MIILELSHPIVWLVRHVYRFSPDPQAKQKVNYNDMSARILRTKTCVFPLLNAFDLSGSALRIKKMRVIIRTQLAELPHLPMGSIPPCKQALKN